MRDVLDALDRLETLWDDGPLPSRRLTKTFHPMHLKECRDAFFFRVDVIARLNRMFTQAALAERYGMSKRAVEEACEYVTFQH